MLGKRKGTKSDLKIKNPMICSISSQSDPDRVQTCIPDEELTVMFVNESLSYVKGIIGTQDDHSLKIANPYNAWS